MGAENGRDDGEGVARGGGVVVVGDGGVEVAGDGFERGGGEVPFEGPYPFEGPCPFEGQRPFEGPSEDLSAFAASYEKYKHINSENRGFIIKNYYLLSTFCIDIGY